MLAVLVVGLGLCASWGDGGEDLARSWVIVIADGLDSDSTGPAPGATVPDPEAIDPTSACPNAFGPDERVGHPFLTTADGVRVARVEFTNASYVAVRLLAVVLVIPPEGGRSATLLLAALVPPRSTATGTATAPPGTAEDATVVVLRSCGEDA